jgi:hypothetical protein
MGASQSIEKARRSLKVAEAMLSKTYPVAKDTKLFLAVAEDIFFALIECVYAVLKDDKKVADEEALMASFEDDAVRLGFGSEHPALLRKLHAIVTAHNESPVEFARKDGFVICDDDYSCVKLTLDDVQRYLFGARVFLERAASIVEGFKDG